MDGSFHKRQRNLCSLLNWLISLISNYNWKSINSLENPSKISSFEMKSNLSLEVPFSHEDQLAEFHFFTKAGVSELA